MKNLFVILAVCAAMLVGIVLPAEAGGGHCYSRSSRSSSYGSSYGYAQSYSLPLYAPSYTYAPQSYVLAPAVQYYSVPAPVKIVYPLQVQSYYSAPAYYSAPQYSSGCHSSVRGLRSHFRGY